MPKGKRPHPTVLRLIKGNPSRRPVNADEPKIPPGLPEPPDHLTPEARQEWDRMAKDLYEVGILTMVDRAALAAYCQAYGRWVRAERILEAMARLDEMTRGMMVRTINGNTIQNPMVGTANRAMGDMMRYAMEFGMTPSARSRIKAENRQEQDEAAKKYLA